MSAVLDWIKTNVVIVVFAVVGITAIVAIPIVAGKLNAAIKSDMDGRVAKLSQLDQLTKTSITLPGPFGEAKSVIIDESLLKRYEIVVQEQLGDAQEVRAAAEAHNSKGRGVLLPRLFPEPPPSEREVLPAQFHRMIIQAHEDLLEEIRAGTPPTAEQMEEDLTRRTVQFRTQRLQKTESEPLTDEESEQLRDALSRDRMDLYAAAAQQISMYASPDALNLPVWDQAYMPGQIELFQWQWQYWINEDILRALASANAGTGVVVLEPVKRVVDVQIYGEPAAAGGERSGGAPPPAVGGTGLASGGTAGRRAGAVPPAAPPATGAAPGASAARPPVDAAREVPLDFTISFTGRKSNPLYDVRYVQLVIVAETARIPEVLDALARHNFITVFDMEINSIDPYEAARSGYLYGSAPVSELTLQLETIWLRAWTTEFMPIGL